MVQGAVCLISAENNALKLQEQCAESKSASRDADVTEQNRNILQS